MKKHKRVIDILVISDVHLGTYGCHAKELLHYLKSIKPKLVILNRDIIAIWQLCKSYWPKSHMKVVKHWWTGSAKALKLITSQAIMMKCFASLSGCRWFSPLHEGVNVHRYLSEALLISLNELKDLNRDLDWFTLISIPKNGSSNLQVIGTAVGYNQNWKRQTRITNKYNYN